MTIPYVKQYQDVPDLVSLLKSRGLTIDNEAKARNYLTNIGYFRLSAYFYPLLEQPKTAHNYKTGFYRQDYFNSSISEIDSELLKSREDFIEHFNNTYTDHYPPAWMIAEILPLGNICRIYKNINDSNLKKKISKQFGLQPIAFESWIMTIAGLRNICCHHSRLWNRVLVLRTSLPQNTQYPWVSNPSTIDIQRVYFRLCMIRYFLFSVSPHNTFKEKLIDLLSKYPSVDINAMGFTANWQNEPLWR